MILFDRLKHWLHATTPMTEPPQMQTLWDHLLASLLTLAWYVEARDPYTGGHLWRVSRYAYLLAQVAGFPPDEVARISLGGFLHDLGKIGVPDAILRKPDRLTDEEYAVIQTHPTLGLRLLAGHPLADLVRHAVQLHHERPDGKGYPLKMTGDAIPVEAKIVSICDAYDAMTSHRPYRPGMSRQQALSNIADALGGQFDRSLGKQFLALGYEGRLDHIQGHSDEGIPLQTCPMCGPTLVLRREQCPDDLLYCRNCGGEFIVTLADSALQAVPTGGRGTPADLEPLADANLIAQVVMEAVNAMPLSALMKDSALLRTHV